MSNKLSATQRAVLEKMAEGEAVIYTSNTVDGTLRAWFESSGNRVNVPSFTGLISKGFVAVSESRRWRNGVYYTITDSGRAALVVKDKE